MENKGLRSIVLRDRAPTLANYPHVRICDHLIYLSGVSSRQLDGSRRGVILNEDGSYGKSIQEQTRGVLDNIKATLEACGSSMDKLIDITVYLTDMSTYAEFNKVYNEYFTKENGPARSTIGVSALPHPSLLVEMKAIAKLS